jgi:hypothetical protein
MKAAVDRRAHLRRKIGGIDDVLDTDGNAAQRPVARRLSRNAMADEGADRLVLCGNGLQRLRNRGVGGKLAPGDAALQIGE